MAPLPDHLKDVDPSETEYQNWVREQVAPLGIGSDLKVHIFYKASSCFNHATPQELQALIHTSGQRCGSLAHSP